MTSGDINILIANDDDDDCQPRKNGANVYVRKSSNFEQPVQVIQHALPMAAENIVTNCNLKYVLNA